MDAECPRFVFVLSALRCVARVAAIEDERLVEDACSSKCSTAEVEPVVVCAKFMVWWEWKRTFENFTTYGQTAAQKAEAQDVAGKRTEDVTLDIIIGGSRGVKMGISDCGVVSNYVAAFIPQTSHHSFDFCR